MAREPEINWAEVRCVMLSAEDPEWSFAWDAAVPGPDKHETNNWESWEYMGTWKLGPDRHWVHEFRHRCHKDSGNRRVYRKPRASSAFHRDVEAGRYEVHEMG